MSELPLSGLRVIECGDGIAGALCAKALADVGADVVKIEPLSGDESRRTGPFPGGEKNTEKSGRFLFLNVNKRDVTLDLDTVDGREKLMGLVREADVFVTDFDPPVLRALALEYSDLAAENSGLIGSFITPFGLYGPYRDFKGGELIAFHSGGLGYETPAHSVTDSETQPPLKLGGNQALQLSGWVAAAGIMAAIHYRDLTGKGQIVDVSKQESVTNIIRGETILHSYDVSRVRRTRTKSGFSASPMFRCKDGYVSISLSQEHWWQTLTDAPGAPPELKAPEYGDAKSRAQNSTALEALITSWFMQYTRSELFAIFNPLRLPCFGVNSMAEVTASAQYAARDFFVQQDHPVAGLVRQPGLVTRLTGVSRHKCRPAPLLGEHNADVLVNGWGAERAPTGASKLKRSENRRQLPLKGVRVLDFGWFYAAPHLGAWLGVLGAEVIRVESATRVEYNRQAANARADGIPGIDRSSIWNGVNFSKLGVTLNLSTDEGKALAIRLADKSDVVIENFSAGVMDRLGLGHNKLSETNPRLITLSCATLGQRGPEAKVSGLGPNIQVYAGLPFMTGYEGGPPGLGGGSWPDFVVGVISTFATLVALRDRERTGAGQHIDMAMAEVITSMIPEAIMNFFWNGEEPERIGNHDPDMAPHNVYRAQGFDQWVAISVSNDDEWRSMCEVMGLPELAEDPRFVDLSARKANESELDLIVSTWTQRDTTYAIMHSLQSHGVAAAPAMSVFDLVASRHLSERGYFVEIDHPLVGPRSTAGIPVKFSEMKDLDYYAAPMLGQHNERVFKGILGMDDPTYDQLVGDHIIH